MYQPPQTFFYDDSPPASPVDRKLPTFQISPAPLAKNEKKEHQIGRSHSQKSKQKDSLPFSYEYVIEEGKLAGLAEYHPDNDYLHYSSSRGSSRTVSRNPSRRTSAEHSGRSTPATRYSTASERSTASPPSPKKTDKLKRALSLSTLKGRSSQEDKRRAPPPLPVPRSKESFVVAFGLYEPKEPAQISPPLQSPTPQDPQRSFEAPRAAPKPPAKHPSSATRNAVPQPIARMPSEVSRKRAKREAAPIKTKKSLPLVKTSEKSFEGPKRSNSTAASVEKVVTTAGTTRISQAPIEAVPRPPLRRKTSKFTEHLDDAMPNADVLKTEDAPPMPSIPPFDFQLPIPQDMAKITSLPEHQASVVQSSSAAEPVVALGHPEWPKFTAAAAASKPETKAQTPIYSGPKPAPHQLSKYKVAGEQPVSNIKPNPVIKPTSAVMLKRATSMRTRPPAIWGDVRMAQMKPILSSPVVASGHARMISC